MIDLGEAREAVRTLDPYRLNGRVSELIGLVIESRGPEAGVGERCEIHTTGHRTGTPPLQAEVVGFREGRTLLMPLGESRGVAPGQTVVATGGTLKVGVGPALLGRVLDGLGQPMDGKPAPPIEQMRSIEGRPPDPLTRPTIDTPLALGVRAIDGLMPCGRGQRMGIFAGSGVGKSTTLGMMARGTSADVNVIALVGERGREVREFIEHDLGPEGLARSVLVIATSDQPALVRIKAAFAATAIAEYFRDLGADVLLMMDSVTRLATAQREVGLAIGEPPATRGYTPSVFAILPRLLERAGASDKGTITGLYTVLVDGDDMNEPVADAVRSILDGHIVLSRELAHRHHYPAIDVLQSVSRVAPKLFRPEEAEAAGRLRSLLAAHKRAEDLIAIGAYVPGTDPRVDEARLKMDRMEAFLTQKVGEPYSREEAMGQLLDLADVSRPAVDFTEQPPEGSLTGVFNPLPPGTEVVPG
ncbi:MAG: FliI/YscN family ATPase [Miltoncostaeaceae bacterium]